MALILLSEFFLLILSILIFIISVKITVESRTDLKIQRVIFLIGFVGTIIAILSIHIIGQLK